MPVPTHPKIYALVPVEQLPSIVIEGRLWSDAEARRHAPSPPPIHSNLSLTAGTASIQQRRLKELTLKSHPELYVGDCVSFCFCPRSIRLYLMRREHHFSAVPYPQQNIVHLEADLHRTVAWASLYGVRWAFTLSNAGSRYFEDRSDLAQLEEIDWVAVQANQWSGTGLSRSVKESKQAEFLVEKAFPWALVSRIGVSCEATYRQVRKTLLTTAHKPKVQIKMDWYY